MAHTEPRPEISTGELVQGSDLDIVVVYRDLLASVVKALELAIYQQKNFLLRNPSYYEEIVISSRTFTGTMPEPISSSVKETCQRKRRSSCFTPGKRKRVFLRKRSF
jgi:hypothetical protein